MGPVLLGALSLAAYSCSSNDNTGGTKSTSCSANPSGCKAGTTCWVGTNGSYACLPAKAGAGQGATCTNVIGQPQCDHGLACFQDATGSASGICMPFCDQGGCSAGGICTQSSLKNPPNTGSILVCGPGPTTDGGNDATATDSGKQANDATTDSIANGNLIENSSFEVGAGHGWGLSGTQIYPLSGLLDKTTGAYGNSSIRLPYNLQDNAQILVSKIYKLKPNKKYTISFYAKSNSSWGAIKVFLSNSFKSPWGPGDVISSGTFMASSNWQRFSFSGTTASDPDKTSYQLLFHPGGQSQTFGNSIWIDAIELEEGNLTDYKPAADVEVGLVSDSAHQGNIFFEDEPVVMNLKQYNSNTRSKSVTIYYEVYDYYNRMVKSGSVNSTIPAQSLLGENLDLTLSKNKQGAFRVILWVGGMNGTREEVNYSVLPRPQTMGVDKNSIIGAHVPFYAYWLSAMQKVGVKWNRTLSTGRQFRWSLAEPTKDNFIWHDAEIGRASTYGMKILGVLGGDGTAHIPDWARDANGFPRLAEWNGFVYKVVNHYKSLVDHWEIWNEPDQKAPYRGNAPAYAQLLKTAYIAAKKADPDSRINCMVTFYASYMEKVFSTIGDDYCDIISTHTYPPTGISGAQAVISTAENHNKPSPWNTETGMKTDSFYQTLLWEDLWITYARPDDWGRNYKTRTDWLVWNFAHTVGLGDQKYFYYDARSTTAPNFLISYSLFEFDGTLRPKAVAYSVLAHFFDGSTGRGEVNLEPDVYAYLFHRGSAPSIILWAKNYNDVKLLNISSSSVEVYDVMGNELSMSNGVTFGHSPIYLEGQGVTQEQLISALSISATSDTKPPNLSMVTFPTGPTNGGRVLFRWFAVDDTSVSTRWKSTSESIVYSYRLEGYDSDWSSWVTPTSATYSNIPNGLYTFRVKAKDAAGNESEVSKVIAVGH